MRRIIGLVQARMVSARLPRKVLIDMEGRPMVWHVVNRMRHAARLDEVVLSIPDNEANRPLAEFAEQFSVPCFAGDELDLIARALGTVRAFRADAMVRVTGDCPFVDPDVLDRLVGVYLDRAEELDYVTNSRPRSYPHGLDAEVWPRATLERLDAEVADQRYREWYPLHVWEHPEQFRTCNVSYDKDLSHLRWTVDYEDDLRFALEIYRRLGQDGRVFRMAETLALLDREPHLAEINAGHDPGESQRLPAGPQGAG